ncbi:hypothetical protein [Bosea sp. (in: a-proteobacteria)]|uniref:hypothetical protein n=1 Tax=Bosea sp. (in: a-proteobacteria) TaxID=1871050 RepID=UPI00260F44A8|nr:hypothetical protein [Bosea sp. (in: a-proteobacteria)]MCO5091967.1 hypothetical protein [Bosea sp. (in: a-proteobacteria)]
MKGRSGTTMGTAIIKIKFVDWRNGRPRFSPGANIRAIGYKAEDLKHPDGRWLSVEEAIAWSARRQAEIEARQNHKARTGRMPPRPRERLITVEKLFDLLWQHPSMRGKAVEEGKHVFRPKSPATVRDYKQKARVIEAEAPELWGASVDALDRVILFNLYELIATKRGLATSTGCIRALSTALSFGMRRGYCKHAVNPAAELGMETPPPRLRVGEREEIAHLVAAADKLGRADIGDSIMLGVWTGQRQSERIDLIDEGLLNGRRIFRQRKTGAMVAIPQGAPLDARLAQAKERRRAALDAAAAEARAAGRPAPIARLELVIDEKNNQPFKPDHYRHLFAAMRDVAVHGLVAIGEDRVVLVKDEDVGPIRHYLPGLRGLRKGEAVKAGTLPHLIEPMPSLAGFRDQDLRDTSVTWLALAGATIPEIAAVTGHSLESITTVLKHYLARHPEMADHAIAKLVEWHG